MERLIERLKAKGLCSSVRTKRDRRVLDIALTGEGVRVVQRIRTVLDEVLELHLADFGQEERGALDPSLSRMVANGGQLPCRARPATPAGASCPAASDQPTNKDEFS